MLKGNEKITTKNHYEDIDIKAQIGPIVFRMLLDSSFFIDDDDWSANNHNHAAFEVHYTIRGNGIFQFGEESINLSENMFCIIAPGIYHTQKEKQGESINKYCMKFDYKVLKVNDKSLPMPFTEIELITETLSKLRFFSSYDIFNNLSLIKDIHNEFENQALGYYTKIQCLFTQIIINILRSIISLNGRLNTIHEKTSDEKRSEIIESYFHSNYFNNATSYDLADLLNVSNRQMDRILKKLYNKSFKEKLIETRIEVAKDLLRNTTLSAYSISKKVGYDSPTNFYNLFKKKTGFTPISYRNSFKVNDPIM